MRNPIWGGLGALAVAFLACGVSLGAGLQSENSSIPIAAAQNWLTNLGDLEGHRYSALTKINRDTVKRLVVRYSVVLGGLINAAGNYDAALPVSPLVKDGFLYIADGWGAVSKVDLGQRGKIVWRSDAGQYNLDAWLQASRGLAFYGDQILSISADGKLDWIDNATGKVTRSVQVGDPIEGYTISAAPLVVGDTVIVGGGGADRGGRAQIDAIDGHTGERLWQRRAGPGDPWTGAFMQTGVYDDTTRTTIWGTSRSGLISGDAEDDKDGGNAIVAFDIATGETRGVYVYEDAHTRILSESGTYQLVADPGGEGQLLSHFGNDGKGYVFDPAGLSLRRVTPYIPSQWQPVAAVADGGAANTVFQWPRGCPNIRSAVAFASAYSLRAGLSYGAGADACHPEVKPIVTASAPGWLGAYYAGADNQLGLLAAINPATGAVSAQRVFDFPLQSGVLATEGGLVFTSTADGTLFALNDETLETVWSYRFATLTAVPPITFEAGGEQYVAVVVGANGFDKALSYRPKDMDITEALYVLVVLGVGA
ncbi:MAG TPA: PQQ-binding-like beta-propeller repeat protein [Devosiaceae bacterium]|jgi:alcohol dehydrogenase (cytochrome c)